MDQLYAYYSDLQAKRAKAFCTYSSVTDGTPVNVTEVSQKEYTNEEILRFRDRKFVGIVNKFISRTELII